MATIIDNESSDHAVTILDDFRKTKIVVVRGGLRTYLWIGDIAGNVAALAEGESVLRALASAILESLPPAPKSK